MLSEVVDTCFVWVAIGAKAVDKLVPERMKNADENFIVDI